MKNTTPLFLSKRFFPLFATQFLGAFNDNAFKNAFLIWFTYDVAVKNNMDAASIVTLAAGLFILPFFLFSATAGQIADKYERSKLTQTIKLIEIILMGLCTVFFFLSNIYGLLAVLFLMGVQSTFFGPIKYSLLPTLLKDDELIRGNGLIEGGTFLSILLGTLFGGLIIRTEYGIGLLSLLLIVFSILGWLSSRRIPTTVSSAPDLKIGYNIVKETWGIISYAREERSVWLSILGISWFWLIGSVFLTQFPTYTKQIIGGNEHIVTLCLTLFSIGIGIGSIACNKLIRGEINGRLVPYGSIGMTIFILDFYFSSRGYAGVLAEENTCALLANCTVPLVSISDFFSTAKGWRIAIDLLMVAVFSGIYIVPLYAIIQHRSATKHLSRIIAANNVMNAFFMAISSVIILIIFSLGFDVIALFLIIGLSNIPVFIVVYTVVKRRLSHA